MEKITVDKIGMDTERQFANFEDLTRKRKALEERMSKAESEKQTVKQCIFERVFTEYENEFQRLASEIEPLAREVEQARSSIENQIEDVEKEVAEVQDKLDELVFRHRVGEFDEASLAKRELPLRKEHERLTQRSEEFYRTLARLEIHNETPVETEGIPTDVAPPAVAPFEDLALPELIGSKDSVWQEPAEGQPLKEQPVEPPSNESDAGLDKLQLPLDVLESDDPKNGETLIDPTEWLDEFVREELKHDSGDASDNQAPPPIDELPVDEPPIDEPPIDELPVDELPIDEPSVGSFPILTITEGAGSGKKLPLLPMTMTLGRELDNNIELKDKDVARYHARISFESGEYVILDLEGSSGTFVNDTKITTATLHPGDTIRAGSTEMTFDLE